MSARVCLGISWDDPDVTDEDKIRYDALWLGEPENGSLEYRMEAAKCLTACHSGSFEDLVVSYRYLIYMAPQYWNLKVHPHRPPFEEFLQEGIRIWVPLE